MLQYLDTIIAFTVVMLGFSLLITVLNQIVSSFLSYRGTNLRWGIQTMLITMAPSLEKEAKEIANKILTQPIVSDSIMARFKNWEKLPLIGPFILRWQLASAIGPDTLIRSLKRVAEERRHEQGGQAEVSSPPEGSSAFTLDQLLREVDPEAARKLRTMHDAFAALNPGYSVKVDEFLAQMGNSTQQSVGKIEAWFNVAMNRVSQRFTMQIRIWTVIFAFLLSFGIHLDSFSLFNQLLTNPTVRQNVINQTDAMLKKADAVLGTATEGQQASGSSDITISPKVLGDKLQELIDKDIDKAKEGTPVLLGSIPTFRTLADAEKWLRDNLNPDVKAERKDQLVTKYKRYVLAGLKDEAKGIIDLLQSSGLELVPGNRPLPGFWDCGGWIRFFFHFDNNRNLLGVILTACMLALGAPFWYNALKTLTNLRPMVAQRQDQQKKDAA